MTVPMILLPLFVQVALTFGLFFWMGSVRVACLRRGERSVGDIVLGQPNWPPRVQQISNAFHNQLQLPTLFYVLVVLALFTRKADVLFVVLAWVFVVSRIVHAIVHTTTNRLTHRFYVFLFGAAVLLLMWIIFAVRILLGL